MEEEKEGNEVKGDMYAKVELVYDRNWHSEEFHTWVYFLFYNR